ncbi:unnamed protein product [Trichogramma brassicae]|uniref:Uncharacterized protein n=1 Tax=Trichogramma brassicae TaxID=86971 RepID=A0A6H5ISA7_9HYME|nr:unnamed protein product [Trichogramma brassicae]
MREEVNWENEDERREFLCKFEDLVSDWKGQFPNLRETFQPYDIDWLLVETIKKKFYWFRNEISLIHFVSDTGYKDEPDLDENGKPLLQRTTAIHHSTRHGKTIINELFKIYDRFDLNYIDDSGLTHFHVACGSGCDEVVKKFLDFGQDPNCIITETGNSPLHSALESSYVNVNKVVQWLLRSGADPHLVNKNGDTALHLALKGQHEEAAIWLMRYGADPSLATKDGDTSLHLALKRRHHKIVCCLLSSSVDPSLANKDGDTLLHLALKHRNNKEVVEWMLRAGAGLSLANKHGETPLHLALKHRYEEIAESILRSGIDLSLANNDGLTPLHLICSYYYYKIDLLEIFFQINDESNQLVRVDARDNKGNTALHLAVDNANEKAAKLLLKRDANPNLADAEGSTTLQIICSSYRRGNAIYSLAKILFDLSNDKYRPLQVDVWDKYGKTPLHHALEQGNKEVVELLLRQGANPNLWNADGWAYLQIICKNYCNDDLAEIFLKTCDDIQRTVRVDVVNYKLNRTPLQCAVASLMPNTVHAILNYGANLSSFVFPTEDYFGEEIEQRAYDVNIKLRQASRALAVCESLEKKGYELDQSNALIMVIKLLTENRVFDKSADFPGFWHGDEKFARDAKEQVVCQDLSLYDVIQWSPEEALKRLKYTDYFEISTYHWIIPKKNWEACELHLCEMMSRGFLRSWATVFFMELTRCKLPFDCCKMIVEHLINKDLCNLKMHIILVHDKLKPHECKICEKTFGRKTDLKTPQCVASVRSVHVTTPQLEQQKKFASSASDSSEKN